MDFPKLVEIMARLRRPEKGCPWDLIQTPQTLKPYIIEEAYELIEAIDSGEAKAICEELGDLLFQIVFQARIQEEKGNFDIKDVIRGIAEKMERRHPHIFGDAKADTPDEVRENWEIIKLKEKGAPPSILSGTPRSLPALMRAWRVSQKAASVGFDWNNASEVIEKVEEEIEEIREVEPDSKEALHEVGDLLFAAVNLARHLDVNPEDALAKATDRFENRFKYIEKTLKEQNRDPSKTDLEELERLWQKAKSQGL